MLNLWCFILTSLLIPDSRPAMICVYRPFCDTKRKILVDSNDILKEQERKRGFLGPNVTVFTPSFQDPSFPFPCHYPSFQDPCPSFQDPCPSFQDPCPSFQDPCPSFQDPCPSFQDPCPSYIRCCNEICVFART